MGCLQVAHCFQLKAILGYRLDRVFQKRNCILYIICPQHIIVPVN